MEALRKMKSGKPQEAVKMLQHLFHRCKNESESAYNAEMALVEILIYQVCKYVSISSRTEFVRT